MESKPTLRTNIYKCYLKSSQKLLEQAQRIFGECVGNAFIQVETYSEDEEYILTFADRLKKCDVENLQFIDDKTLDIDIDISGYSYDIVLEFYNGIDPRMVHFSTSKWAEIRLLDSKDILGYI